MIKAGKLRLQRLSATQKAMCEADLRRLADLVRRLRAEMAAHPSEQIWLWPTDAALLVRAAELDLAAKPSPKTKRAAV